MSSFTITRTIIQHTPIIHFQDEQEGATLRASELKSKINRYVEHTLRKVDKAFYDEYFTTIIEPYFLEKDNPKPAPFKLKISPAASEDCDRYLIASYIPKYKQDAYRSKGFKLLDKSPYFANNSELKDGNLGATKKGLMLRRGIELKLTVFSFNKAMLAFVERILPYVFAYDNFGTRQSKGFGSFTIKESGTSASDFEALLAQHDDYSNRKTLKLTISAQQARIFAEIDKEYKVLKAGFLKDPSQLQVYFKEQGIDWEKDIIKRELIGGRGNSKSNSYTGDNDPQYVRAVLGLAELYEFPKKRAKVTIRHKEGTIERYRSPLTFKVFVDDNNKAHIYILANQVDEGIMDKEFMFKLNERESITLKTPKEFDVGAFLKLHVHERWSYMDKK